MYPGDYELLTNVSSWPRVDAVHQTCCVKKYPKDLRPGAPPTMDCFGMLLAINGQIMNEDGKTGVTILRDGFTPINYESIDAMVADGWVVD